MLQTHGDLKYQAGSLLTDAAALGLLRVEHRLLGAGAQKSVRPECTELVYILSGRAKVRRRADGPLQEGLALPGTCWLVPAGTDETLLELDGTTECLIIFLPAQLLEESALRKYGIDPGRAEIVYAGGFTDSTLSHLSLALRDLVARPAEPLDQLFADGLRLSLAAHLVANYNLDRWRPKVRLPMLEPRRLRRVLDYIEAHLAGNISIEDLAGEACLSPFHFSRLFHEATGRSPHRYLVERRIESAKRMIIDGRTSLVEVALDTGFGSQANFSRAFRKSTGISPTQFRAVKGGLTELPFETEQR